MPDNQYLSIGEVLGLLLEDFPDVTISKIRFLESQGLIEPERTPSGYRKFYDHDVDLLRAILHEQKANFLPLKVIRDRIESGAMEGDLSGIRTPPRGIRNVGARPPVEQRDSVFRRTDGGPEWTLGRVLIPGDPPASGATASGSTASGSTASGATASGATASGATASGATDRSFNARSSNPSAAATSSPPPPITAAIPVTSSAPVPPAAPKRAAEAAAPAVSEPEHAAAMPVGVVAALIEAPPVTPQPVVSAAAAKKRAGSPSPAPQPLRQRAVAETTHARSSRADQRLDPGDGSSSGLPYSREEICAAAEISPAQLADLESFAIVTPRGSGADASYSPDALEIARVAGRFLAQGIDARHLRAWRQSAERESALFEQRIMPLLRQRNPQSRHNALGTLAELAELGSQLRGALVDSLLRHHFDGT